MRTHALIGTIIIATIVSCTSRHRMVNYDLAYTYQPGSVIINKRFIEMNDSLKIFLSFYNPSENKPLNIPDFIRTNKLMYKITHDHLSGETLAYDSINLDADKVKISDKTYYINFTIPKLNFLSYLLIIYKKDINKNRTEAIDVPIELSSTNLSRHYIFYNQKTNTPVLDNYIIKNDTVIIKKEQGDDELLYAYHYNHNFSAAHPPMDLSNDGEKEKLSIDTSYFIKTNQPITFELPGLYFIQKDTNTDAGFSVLAKDYKFPSLTRAEEMLEPLIYLVSKEEKMHLEKTLNPKITLDSFWLKIGDSREYSRQMIKSFYQKVEFTNKVFTSYKEGWKTDRGMIYIIFGKPDYVYKTEEGEEWVYENIMIDMINFVFIKKPNIFSEDHYELVRNPSYYKYWYTTIEKWKSGIITK